MFIKKITLQVISCLHLLFFGWCNGAFSAEFEVTDVDELRSAVQQANASAEDDIINIKGGTYTLSGLALEDGSATGDLDIKSNLVLQGEGTRETILEGGGDDRVVHIIGDFNVTLNDLTIRGGRVTGQHGAGIFLESGSNGSLNLNRSWVTDNDNSTTGLSPFFGGGIHIQNGLLTINNSTISKNNAGLTGGGISNQGTELLINSSTISGNTARSGAGIDNRTPTGDIIIESSTITQNIATNGGGGMTPPDDTKIFIHNSILVGNEDVSLNAPDCGGGVDIFISEGFNLIGCEITPNTGDQIGTEADPIDPLLGPLQNNGGPTDTHALLDGSPALDMGDPSCTGTDQRGITRPQGNACDIGAFEREVGGGGGGGGGESGGCALSAASRLVGPFQIFWILLLGLGVLRRVQKR